MTHLGDLMIFCHQILIEITTIDLLNNLLSFNVKYYKIFQVNLAFLKILRLENLLRWWVHSLATQGCGPREGGRETGVFRSSSI